MTVTDSRLSKPIASRSNHWQHPLVSLPGLARSLCHKFVRAPSISQATVPDLGHSERL